MSVLRGFTVPNIKRTQTNCYRQNFLLSETTDENSSMYKHPNHLELVHFEVFFAHFIEINGKKYTRVMTKSPNELVTAKEGKIYSPTHHEYNYF